MVKTFFNGVLLPVNPLDDITVQIKSDNKTYTSIALGEISRIGRPKLKSIKIKSLFTDQVYPFTSTSSAQSTRSYVDMIELCMSNQQTARLIIIGDGIDINMLCSVESFKPKIAWGETNERYYELELQEYREPAIKRIQLAAQPSPNQPAPASASKSNAKGPEKPKTYVVKSGDCLWNIAKKYYGNGAQYTKIYEANKDKIKKPSLVYAGQELVIP